MRERSLDGVVERQCRHCTGWFPRTSFRKDKACAHGYSAECNACRGERRWHELRARVCASNEPWLQLQSELTSRRLSVKRSELLHQAAGHMGFSDAWDLAARAPERLGEMFDAVMVGQRYRRSA